MSTPGRRRREDFAIAAARAVAAHKAGFLLESPPSALHPRNLQFSWLPGPMLFGWNPEHVLEIRDADTGDPLRALSEFLGGLESGGAIAVGYISYDLGACVEPTAASVHPPDSMPHLAFGIYKEYYRYEPPTGRLFV
ncbi:MAG: hypothetical protein J7M19_05120, partial [Planctomycetes bacterium]|nr:hypothetical protein [Planctomycetota bacterium]